MNNIGFETTVDVSCVCGINCIWEFSECKLDVWSQQSCWKSWRWKNWRVYYSILTFMFPSNNKYIGNSLCWFYGQSTICCNSNSSWSCLQTCVSRNISIDLSCNRHFWCCFCSFNFGEACYVAVINGKGISVYTNLFCMSKNRF